MIVPALVFVSCLLLLFQPRLTTRVSHAGNERSPYLLIGLVLAGAYAAYFGSAVGIMLIAILGLFVLDSMQRLNATRSSSPASPTCSPRSSTPSSPRSTGARR